MGGKGGGGDYPPPINYNPPPDLQDTMGPVLDQMNTMMGEFAAIAAQPPPIPEMPEPIVTAPVDWEAKREEFRAKALAEQEAYAKSRKGLASTILTNPVLGEEDEQTDMLVSALSSPVLQSILTG